MVEEQVRVEQEGVEYWKCVSLDGINYQFPLQPEVCGIITSDFKIYLDKERTRKWVKVVYQGSVYNATAERFVRSSHSQVLPVAKFFKLNGRYSTPKQTRALFEVFLKVVQGKRFAIIPVEDQRWFTIEDFSEAEQLLGEVAHKGAEPKRLPEPKKSAWTRFWDKYGYEVSDF